MPKHGSLLKFLLFVFLLLPISLNAMNLHCVVEYTVRTNPNIQQTIHALEATNELVKQAQSTYYPSLDLTAVQGLETSRNVNTNFEVDTLWRRQLGVTLRQILFDGFATRNAELRTMASTDASAFRIYAESEDIALAAAESYINVIRDKELIAYGEENVRAHERLVHMINRRVKQGVGRASENYQAEGRLAEARTILLSLQSTFNEDVITFQRVTGLCPDCLEPPPNPCRLPCDECDALRLAICFHPTLKQALAEIQSARAQHREAFAPNFPRLDLVLRSNSDANLSGIPGPNENNSILLEMQWNLFRGGRDMARQRQTAFNVKETIDVREQTYRSVVERMSLSWNLYLISEEKKPSLFEHMTNAQKSIVAFNKLFLVGRTNLFELLDIQREQYFAAQDYVLNKYLNIVAKYRILNAMGELNYFLCVPLSCHVRPCYGSNERACCFVPPGELDYRCVKGGCACELCKPPSLY